MKAVYILDGLYWPLSDQRKTRKTLLGEKENNGIERKMWNSLNVESTIIAKFFYYR